MTRSNPVAGPGALASVALLIALATSTDVRGQSSGSALAPSKELVFPPAPVREWAGIKENVDRGLHYLRKQQAESGAIGSSYMVAVTSLAGLAALGAGHQPSEEPHGKMLQKCLDYLSSVASASGSGIFITEPGEGGSRMHGHCYAVLFLCELYGSLPGQDERIADLVKRSIAVIEGAQSKEGGWYYLPQNRDLDEASVTVCALQALRAARNAGFSVDAGRVRRAIEYVRRSQTAEGSFKYSRSLIEGADRTTYALTAAALSTLNAAGVYKSSELQSVLQKGFDHLRREIARHSKPWFAAEAEHDFYANLYAAQTFYQDGGGLWAEWYPRIREHLISKQRSDGSWESRFGDEYATAMALLILEVPLGYLPMFQR